MPVRLLLLYYTQNRKSTVFPPFLKKEKGKKDLTLHWFDVLDSGKKLSTAGKLSTGYPQPNRYPQVATPFILCYNPNMITHKISIGKETFNSLKRDITAHRRRMLNKFWESHGFNNGEWEEGDVIQIIYEMITWPGPFLRDTIVITYNDLGQVNSVNGYPAIIITTKNDQYKYWFKDNNLHNLRGPAFIGGPDNKVAFYINGFQSETVDRYITLLKQFGVPKEDILILALKWK